MAVTDLLTKIKKNPSLIGYILLGTLLLFFLLFWYFFGFATMTFLFILFFVAIVYVFFKFVVVLFDITKRVFFVGGILLFILIVFVWGISSPSINKRNKKTSGPYLEACTSKPGAPLQSIEGLTYDIYGGVLDVVKGSPDPKDENSVRTFSLKGLQEKTEKNSLYFMIRKADDSTIKGYDETIEVCNKDNKGSSTYLTKYQSADGVVKEDSVVARYSYLHGGKYYILEPGAYRVDGYVRDLNGKWVLVAREEGIVITE